MTTLPIPLRPNDAHPALLQLPEAPSAENLSRLEGALGTLLQSLRRDLRVHEEAAALAEYASWLRLLRTHRG